MSLRDELLSSDMTDMSQLYQQIQSLNETNTWDAVFAHKLLDWMVYNVHEEMNIDMALAVLWFMFYSKMNRGVSDHPLVENLAMIEILDDTVWNQLDGITDEALVNLLPYSHVLPCGPDI